MVLIKNVPTTYKGDWYLKTQQYTILTNVINETIWACLLKLHNKLSITQLALKDVILILSFYSKTFWINFSNSMKKIKWCQMIIYRSFIFWK
jgi:hypothetical protein